MLRVAFLGISGDPSTRCLEAVAQRHRVVAVVESRSQPNLLKHPLAALRDRARRLKHGPGALEKLATRLGLPHMFAHSRGDPAVARRLLRLRPDVTCIAGYKWILPADIYTIPRLGTINLHSSLLPRQRGPMPLFWLYQQDDRAAGVTIHWVSEHADAGEVIRQEAFPLARGTSIVDLHSRCAELGARLLLAALDDIENGCASRIEQDAQLATDAPMVRPGVPIAQFEDWDVERVWHVLAGLFPLFRQPLVDETGRSLRYGGVLGYERRSHSGTLGSVTRVDGHYEMYCRDGIVRLAPGAVTSPPGAVTSPPGAARP